MTDIQHLMQTNPAKADALFAKPLDTSAAAVRTRDRLFSELKGELDVLVDLQEQHLLPVLKKHEDTKDLAAEALNDSRQTRKLLGELERTPKDSEAFGTKVAELRNVFQQHLRDDKNAFLPAVMKALSDETAGAGAEKAKDETTGSTPARRASGDERQPQDEHATRAARLGADIVQAGTEVAQQGAAVARVATEATMAAAGAWERAARSMAASADTHEPARKTADLASAGASIMTLLNEQARQAIETHTTSQSGAPGRWQRSHRCRAPSSPAASSGWSGSTRAISPSSAA